jgi:hypothetical protein
MIQIFMYLLIFTLFFDTKTVTLGDIKKGFKKATKETGKGLKTAAQETKKGIEKGHKETAKGLAITAQQTKTGVETTAKETEKNLETSLKETEKDLETAARETEKGLEIGAEKTEEVLIDFGKSQYEPFVKPGKELNALKTEMYYGVGGGKTVDKGDTATWHIGTECLIGVKAWKVQKLQTTAGAYITMTPDQKVNTDIDIAFDEMKKKNKTLNVNDTITYNKFLESWTVYEVTAGDNQCIHHNFAVKEKNGKISISKTK